MAAADAEPRLQPPELVDEAGLGADFDEAMQRSAALYDALDATIPHQASYAVSMAYRLRYVMQFNAREAIHMLELRSSPQGHPSYRRVALEMHRLISEQAGHHAVAATMSHMTTETPELERLESERRAEPNAWGRSRATTVCDGCHTRRLPPGEAPRPMLPPQPPIRSVKPYDEIETTDG